MGGEYTQVAAGDNEEPTAAADDNDDNADQCAEQVSDEQDDENADVPARLPKPGDVVVSDDCEFCIHFDEFL